METLFRQLHHLEVVKDIVKIIYPQVLNYYIKNVQSTGKSLSKLLKLCISLQYKCLKVKYC